MNALTTPQRTAALRAEIDRNLSAGEQAEIRRRVTARISAELEAAAEGERRLRRRLAMQALERQVERELREAAKASRPVHAPTRRTPDRAAKSTPAVPRAVNRREPARAATPTTPARAATLPRSPRVQVAPPLTLEEVCRANAAANRAIDAACDRALIDRICATYHEHQPRRAGAR